MLSSDFFVTAAEKLVLYLKKSPRKICIQPLAPYKRFNHIYTPKDAWLTLTDSYTKYHHDKIKQSGYTNQTDTWL